MIPALGHQPLLLGRSQVTSHLLDGLASDLQQRSIRVSRVTLQNDCCKSDLRTITVEALNKHADAVIAAGGGKVLDAGKLLAHKLQLPCITIPLSAATCAGWTALSNIYSPEGAFQSDVSLERCPDLIIFDHNFVLQAPVRTLASGIADALAKWYETWVVSNTSEDGITQQAIQIARVLRDQLLIDGVQAIQKPGSEAWIRAAEASALTAGIVSGLRGSYCCTVAAHAVHNGLTQLPACRSVLHGEKVGFGILVQLYLEERYGYSHLAGQARRQLLPFLRKLGLPVSLNCLGLGDCRLSDLRQVCNFACREGSSLHQLPFPVSENALLAALVGASECCGVQHSER
ncbi:oxidoreductase [cyanobiont of Ornithocercus magnificus]|nr:oxidoreductase [cyanobiont of Ornithocercus magnificus]